MLKRTGYLTIAEINGLIKGEREYSLSAEQIETFDKAFDFLEDFASKKVIYGINTGFGPMAQYRVKPEEYINLQYNLIRSHSNGLGERLSPDQIKAVMVCRLHTLALGRSGVSPGIIHQLMTYLKHDILPIIYYHGGVGASGDLVQLAHVGLGLIGEGECYYKGEVVPVADALKAEGLEKAELKLRDGLAIVNGTSCMTGMAALNVKRSQHLLFWSIAASAMLNELVEAFDDSFSKELNYVKLHPGQRYVAARMRDHVKGSELIQKRQLHDFDERVEESGQIFQKKVQEYYSLRCVPQILGPVAETIDNTAETVEREMNSANDNPIISMEEENVFHGGNFHGDYIAFEMDKLKLAITKMTMLAERQLNFLMNDKLNEKFPPFLNAGVLGLNYGLQGMVFSATSTTAENQALSTSLYIHSIPCNNDNQDIVSMGANAARVAEHVIENSAQVMSLLLLALAQAADFDGLKDRLSPASKDIYRQIRSVADRVEADKPISHQLKALKDLISNEERFSDLDLNL